MPLSKAKSVSPGSFGGRLKGWGEEERECYMQQRELCCVFPLREHRRLIREGVWPCQAAAPWASAGIRDKAMTLASLSRRTGELYLLGS